MSPDMEKVLAKTRLTESCWLFEGYIDRRGYGRIWLNGKPDTPHRVAYRETKGAIPDGLTIDHICFVTNCVNPAHLRTMTHLENSKRQRSALKTHCVNGHEFTTENTYLRPSGGRRQCRKCQLEAVRRYAARKGAA
jgi:hypothetical protein